MTRIVSALGLMFLMGVGVESLHAQTLPADLVPAISHPYDANGLLLNPVWGSGRPLNVAQDCKFRTGPGEPGHRPLLIVQPNCITDWQLLRLNESGGHKVGGNVCRQFNDEALPQGHVHLFPVTMTGLLSWTSYNRGRLPDHDHDLDLLPYKGQEFALTTGNDPAAGIHLEFWGPETLARLLPKPERWWNRIRDSSAGSNSPLNKTFVRYPAIVTGLYSFDAVHNDQAELHPVLAMAVLHEVSSNGDGDRVEKWAFFVRDRGNEGECTDGVVPFVMGREAGRLPDDPLVYRFTFDWRAGADAVEIDQTPGASWVATTLAAANGPYFRVERGKAVQAEFEMPAPARGTKDAFIFGEIHFIWRHSANSPRILSAAQEQAAAAQRPPGAQFHVGLHCPAFAGKRNNSEVTYALGLSCEEEIPPRHDFDLTHAGPLIFATPRSRDTTGTWAFDPDVIVCTEADSRCNYGRPWRLLTGGGLTRSQEGDGRVYPTAFRLGFEISPGRWPIHPPVVSEHTSLGLQLGWDTYVADKETKRHNAFLAGVTVQRQFEKIEGISAYLAAGPGVAFDWHHGHTPLFAPQLAAGIRLAQRQPINPSVQANWIPKAGKNFTSIGLILTWRMRGGGR